MGFRSRIRNISIVQRYPLTETFNTREKDAFYVQLNAVQKGFPRNNMAIMMGDQNAKVNSDLGGTAIVTSSSAAHCSNTEFSIRSIKLQLIANVHLI